MQAIRSSPAAWRLQDAKAQFSAVVDKALRGVPQHVTRRGKEAVVVISTHDYEVLRRSASSQGSRAPTLIDYLLTPMVHPAQDDWLPDERLGLTLREVDFS
jgi:prevent-host-death family protein